MKTIGIDARLYFQTGVGVYVRNLLYELQQLPQNDVQFYVYILEEDKHRVTMSNPQFILKTVTERWHTLAEQATFLYKLYRDDLDLMHFTYFSHPILYRRKFVSTIHDVTLLLTKTGSASTHHPLLYQIKHQAFVRALKHQVMSSTSIITPTRTVKQQIISLFGGRHESKIVPIYEGIDREFVHAKENIQLKHTLPERYLLYVGNFYPHKNIERFIDAFSSVKGDVSLVLVGPHNYFFERIQKDIDRRGLSNRAVLFPNATNSDLAYMYRHAVCYVQPSLSEGFGLPVIEAMHFGCPVVVSSIPVFKEIAPQATMFDPHDTADMQRTIQKVVNSPHVIHRMTLPEEYSFKRMAEQTQEVYNRALSNL